MHIHQCISQNNKHRKSIHHQSKLNLTGMHGRFSMLYNAPTPQSQSPQGKDAQ